MMTTRSKVRHHPHRRRRCRYYAIPPTSNDEEEKKETTTAASVVAVESLAAIVIIALVSIASSLGVFWSEVAVFQTGCGPLSMPDWLERSCYLGVLVVAGISVFTRIVFMVPPAQGGRRETDGQMISPASLLLGEIMEMESPSSNKQTRNILPLLRRLLQVAEALALLAVLGAVVVLGNQVLNGETMDGMSGIDLEKCRARQSFERGIESIH